MYHYTFDAAFLTPFFNSSVIAPALTQSLSAFNALKRKNFKRLTVTLVPGQPRLRFSLVSAVSQRPENYLRCCQYLSKQLAADPAMAHYIVGGRLLEQC